MAPAQGAELQSGDRMAPLQLADIATWDAEVRIEREGPAGDLPVPAANRNVTFAVRKAEDWRTAAVRAFFPVR